MYRSGLLAGLCLCITAHICAHAEQQRPRISHIAICGNERTDEEIIRRELLFAVGEYLYSSRVAETERNLAGR